MDRPAHQTLTRPHSGGREDCWSEDATKILIDVWGDRYLSLNRGNLRQKDWKEVSDAVNSRYQDGAKPFRTDVQCKNRIDTLKKKYKVEKVKPPPSNWPFYHRLEFLIGSNALTQSNKKPITSIGTLTAKPTNSSSRPGPKPPLAYPMSSMSEDQDEEEGKEGHDGRGVGFDGKVVVRKHTMDTVGLSDDAACRELARAISKFGEIYERMESSKQQQILELEKQRMEFTKDLEFQRLNMFMDARVEIEKNKRSKRASSASG